MTKSTNSKIQVVDFNSIQTQANSILGTGTGSQGYGQPVNSTSASTSRKVSLTDLNNLRNDILNIAAHQQSAVPALVPIDLVGTDSTKINKTHKIKAGTVNFTGVIAGTTLTVTANNTNLTAGHIISGTGVTANTILIRALSGYGASTGTWQVSVSQTVSTSTAMLAEHPFDQYSRVMGQLYATPFYIDNAKTKSTKVSKTGTWASVIGATAWSSRLSATATVTFATADDARHFFNSGGKIKFSSSHTGDRATTQNTSWTNLLSANTGRLFGGDVPTAGAGSDGQNYYRLTNAKQVWTSVSPSGPAYLTNFWKISAYCDQLTNGNGTAKVITFFIDWICNYAGSPTDITPSADTVGGTVVLDVETLEPDSTLLPSSTKFSIPSPTVAVSEIEAWSVWQNKNSVSEGTTNADGSVGSISFTVNTSNASPVANWVTSFPGTNAVSLDDFSGTVAESTPIVFTNGSSTLIRDIAGDFATEGAEKFQISISNASDSTIVGPMSLVTINDTYPMYYPSIVTSPSPAENLSVNTDVTWSITGAWPFDTFNYTLQRIDADGKVLGTNSYTGQTIISSGANAGNSTLNNYTYVSSVSNTKTKLIVTFSSLISGSYNPLEYTTNWTLPPPVIAYDPNNPKTINSVSITFTCSTATQFRMYKKGPTDNEYQIDTTLTVNDGGSYSFTGLGAGKAWSFKVTASMGGASPIWTADSNILSTTTAYNPVISYVATGTALTNNSWSISGAQPNTGWSANQYATVSGSSSGTTSATGTVQNGITSATWEGTQTTTFTFSGDNTAITKTMVIVWAPPPLQYYVSDNSGTTSLTVTQTNTTDINQTTSRSIYIKVTQGYGTINVKTNSKTPSTQTLEIGSSSDGGGTQTVSVDYPLSAQGTQTATVTLKTTPSAVAANQTSSFYISSSSSSTTFTAGFSVSARPLAPTISSVEVTGSNTDQVLTVIVSNLVGYSYTVYVYNQRTYGTTSQSIASGASNSVTFSYSTVDYGSLLVYATATYNGQTSNNSSTSSATFIQPAGAPTVTITTDTQDTNFSFTITAGTGGTPTSYAYSTAVTTAPSSAETTYPGSAVTKTTTVGNETWWVTATATNGAGTSAVRQVNVLTRPAPPTLSVANTNTDVGGFTITISSPNSLNSFFWSGTYATTVSYPSSADNAATGTSGAIALLSEKATYAGYVLSITANVSNTTGISAYGHLSFVALPAKPTITFTDYDNANSPGCTFTITSGGGIASSYEYRFAKGSAPTGTWTTGTTGTAYEVVKTGTAGDVWYVQARAKNSADAYSNIASGNRKLIHATPPTTPTFGTFTDTATGFTVIASSSNADSISWTATPEGGTAVTGSATGTSATITIDATAHQLVQYTISVSATRFDSASSPAGTATYTAPVAAPLVSAAITGNTYQVSVTPASGNLTITAAEYSISTTAFAFPDTTTDKYTVTGTASMYAGARSKYVSGGTTYYSQPTYIPRQTVVVTNTSISSGVTMSYYGATVTATITGAGGGGGGADTSNAGGKGGNGAIVSLDMTLPATHNRLLVYAGRGGGGGKGNVASGTAGAAGAAGSGGNWGGGPGGTPKTTGTSGGGGGGGSDVTIKYVDSSGTNGTTTTMILVGGGGGGGGGSAGYPGSGGSSASSFTVQSTTGILVGATEGSGSGGTAGNGGGGGGAGGGISSTSHAAAGTDGSLAAAGGIAGEIRLHPSAGTSNVSVSASTNGGAGGTNGGAGSAGGDSSISMTYPTYTLQ